MRAAVLEQFNEPWKIRDMPDPRPEAGQVLIRVATSGFCGTDLHVHHGYLGGTPPFVAGHEPVGTIVELGAGVTSLSVGDRVGVSWNQKGCGRCKHCQEGRVRFCAEGAQTWMQLGGGFSELMLAWADGCTLIPQGLPNELASPILCAGYTVFSALRDAEPRPGERVAVLGVGGLGHMALMYSKALGLQVVAITGQANKREELAALGADDVIAGASDVGQALREIGSADVVLTTSNSAAQVSQLIAGLRPGGRLVNVGNLDGPIEASSMAINYTSLRILGSTQGSRRDLVEALELAAAGRVKPRVELYPLDEINDVRERVAAGKVRYRAVLAHVR